MTGPQRSHRVWLPAVLLGLGAGWCWWAIGFLPWLTDGLRSDLLTGGPFAEDQGVSAVRMAVPLVAEHLPVLVAMSVLGGLAAGALAGTTQLPRLLAVLAVVAGVVLAALVALGQADHAAASVSGPFASDGRVRSALAMVVVLGTASGLLAGATVALAPPWVRPLALAAPLALLPLWVQEALPGERTAAPLWLTPVALGLVLGLSATRPAHLLGWPAALGLGWAAQAVVPALLVAGSAIRPGSGLARHPWYPAEAAWDVFAAALTTPEAHRPGAWAMGLLLAVAVAALRAGRPWARPAPVEDGA